MKVYLHILNESNLQSLIVANSILEYYGPKAEAEELRFTHNEIFHKYFAEFKLTIERDVIVRLNKLIEKYKGMSNYRDQCLYYLYYLFILCV